MDVEAPRADLVSGSMRRSLRVLGTLLLVAGVLLLAWVVVVWRWQDPFTAIQTYFSQKHLRTEYTQQSDAFRRTLPRTPAPDPSAAWREARIAAGKYRATLRTGGPVGRLKIGRLGLDIYVVQGTDHESLKKGPGHYVASGVPGQGRLIYIAGHRTTYLAPFADINDIRVGDYMTFEVPYGTFEYRAVRHYVVPSNDLAVLRNRGTEVLRLQACHPRFFATHRYIVDANLVAFTPAHSTALYAAPRPAA
jgi:sortase A